MQHTVNRAAFLKLDTNSPILRLYCRLVALELLLKDHARAASGSWLAGHDVVSMAREVAVDVGLHQQATIVDRWLSALWCTGRDGTAKLVTSQSYPDIRYLRHRSDFTASSSADVDLNNALLALDDLIRELRLRGVAA